MSLNNEDGEISLVIHHLSLGKQITKDELELLLTVGCRSVDEFIVPINMVAFGDMEPTLAMATHKS